MPLFCCTLSATTVVASRTYKKYETPRLLKVGHLGLSLISSSVCPITPGTHIRNLIQHCEPAALPTYLEYSEFLESPTGDSQKKEEEDAKEDDAEDGQETETEEARFLPFCIHDLGFQDPVETTQAISCAETETQPKKLHVQSVSL